MLLSIFGSPHKKRRETQNNVVLSGTLLLLPLDVQQGKINFLLFSSVSSRLTLSPPPTCPNTIKTQHLQLSRASTQMSQYIERAKKALNNKQRHLMIMEHQRGGPYISNQVRMHACHLTSKHCTYIFDLLQENPQ